MPQPQPTISDDLRRDLALVLPGVARLAEPARALVRGRPVEISEAINHAADLLRKAKAPAVAGLSGLSIEAAREAIHLTQTLRGKLLPAPRLYEPITLTQAAGQAGTLGDALAADALLLVGEAAADHPVTARLRERVKKSIAVGDGLSEALSLRAALRQDAPTDPRAAALFDHKRVVVLLAPGLDERAVSTWHALAAEAQQRVRLSIIALPDLASYGNTRGAGEAITWTTGLSAATGGVDFADGAPRPCADLQTLLARGAIDVLIDTALRPIKVSGVMARIRFGGQPDADAEVCFIVDGLAVGRSARVMRVDGIVLYLSDAPDEDAGDEAAALLVQLRTAMEDLR